MSTPSNPGGWDAPASTPLPPSNPTVRKASRRIEGTAGFYDPMTAAVQPSAVIARDPAERPRVGGWLLVFVVERVLIGPLWTLLMAVGYWVGLDAIYDLEMGILAAYPGLVYAAFAEVTAATAVTAYGVYAGLAVWRLRPFAPATAKSSILASMAFAAFQAALPFLATLPPEWTIALTLMSGASAVLVFAGLTAWYLYFRMSERVARTFPLREPGTVQGLGL
jgi:hypothetical protein